MKISQESRNGYAPACGSTIFQTFVKSTALPLVSTDDGETGYNEISLWSAQSLLRNEKPKSCLSKLNTDGLPSGHSCRDEVLLQFSLPSTAQPFIATIVPKRGLPKPPHYPRNRFSSGSGSGRPTSSSSGRRGSSSGSSSGSGSSSSSSSSSGCGSGNGSGRSGSSCSSGSSK